MEGGDGGRERIEGGDGGRMEGGDGGRGWRERMEGEDGGRGGRGRRERKEGGDGGRERMEGGHGGRGWRERMEDIHTHLQLCPRQLPWASAWRPRSLCSSFSLSASLGSCPHHCYWSPSALHGTTGRGTGK